MPLCNQGLKDVWVDQKFLVQVLVTARLKKRLTVLTGSCSAGRFRVTATADEVMELEWLASLESLARSLISWISVKVNNELKVLRKSGASRFRTSSMSIIPLLS